MIIHCRYDALVDPKTLKPHPKNPNVHTIEHAKNIMQLVKFYGWRHAIQVSNLSGYIAAGHLRHMGALMEELTEVPVVYMDFRDSDEEYGWLVADNGSQEWSEIDRAKVNSEIEHLGLDDISLLGLEDFTLDPAELPAPRSKKPKVCPNCSHEF